MKKKSSRPASPARQKLIDAIEVAEKQAESARKQAKLAKLSLKSAKLKYKDARKVAKKARKAAERLRKELASLSRRKRRAKKSVPSEEPAPKSASTKSVSAKERTPAPPKVAQVVKVAPVKVEIPAYHPEPAPPAPAPVVPPAQ